MKNIIMSGCLAALLLSPSLGLADEIESNFMAGYRMGFFMAVASGNPEKLCGNVYFQTMNEVINKYVQKNGKNYPLKYREILDLEAEYFPCSEAPSTSQDKN